LRVQQILVFSVTAMANPTLLAAATVLLILPNPKKLMLGYLAGALMTSVTLGLVIVFALQDSAAVDTAKRTINPALDIALGAILLVVSIVIATGRRPQRKPKEPTKDKAPPRWKRELSKGSPRITFVVGALLTLPGFSYLAALSGIVKLTSSTVATVLLVLMVNVIMLALIEVPLITFAVAPDWTPRAIERTKTWFSRNARVIAVRGTAILGILLILRGVITLID
jgi:Sap, sulfolipid-1-addressing protein